MNDKAKKLAAENTAKKFEKPAGKSEPAPTPALNGQQREKDTSYILTLFKILDSHGNVSSKWRGHFSGHKDAFETEWKVGKHPEVAEKVQYSVDRVTGDITKL